METCSSSKENVLESNRLWQKVKENMLRLVRLNFIGPSIFIDENLVNCWKLLFHRKTISSEASTTSQEKEKNTNNRNGGEYSPPIFFTKVFPNIRHILLERRQTHQIIVSIPYRSKNFF